MAVISAPDRATSVHVTAPRFRLGYRPELDGIRAFAVLAVMAYHLQGFSGADGGHIGVDLFFVLSGFLITTILIDEWHATGDIRLRSFYLRRVLRLAPALFALLLACTAVAAVGSVVSLPGFGDEKVARMWRAIPAAALYVSNWVAAFGITDLGPLLHTWSLAIEEQFYLLWPPLLVLLLRRGVSRSLLAYGLGAACIGVALLRYAVWQSSGPDRAYYGLDTRADALLIGCLVAVVATSGWFPSGTVATRIAAVGALAGVGVYAVTIPGTLPVSDSLYQGRYTAIELAGAAILLYLLIAPRGAVHTALSWPVLVWIGRLSYALYLWHVPIYQAIESTTAIGWAAQIAFSFLAAIGSYVVIERPALRLKSRLRRVPEGAPA